MENAVIKLYLFRKIVILGSSIMSMASPIIGQQTRVLVSARHGFPSVEWVLPPIRQLLATPKLKVSLLHHCTNVSNPVIVIIHRLHSSVAGQDYRTLLSIGSLCSTFCYYQELLLKNEASRSGPALLLQILCPKSFMSSARGPHIQIL